MFRKIHDVIIPEMGSIHGRHIKLLVNLNLSQALPRATKLKVGSQTASFLSSVVTVARWDIEIKPTSREKRISNKTD